MDDTKLLETLRTISGGITELADRLLIEQAVNTALVLALIKANAFDQEHIAALGSVFAGLQESRSDRFREISDERLEGLLSLVKTHGRRGDDPRNFDA